MTHLLILAQPVPQLGGGVGAHSRKNRASKHHLAQLGPVGARENVVGAALFWVAQTGTGPGGATNLGGAKESLGLGTTDK